jgi:hypothetical protein
MNKLSTKLSNSSQQLYEQKINKLTRLVTDLTDTSSVITAIQNISSNMNTQKTYFQALVYHLPDIPEYKIELEKIYTYLLTDKRMNKKCLTPHQQQSAVTWEELIELRDSMITNLQTAKNANSKYIKKQPYKQLLLISLYTYIPPRRIQDFTEMHCYVNRPENVDPAINYYIQSEQKFIFNTYKTSSTHGTQEVSIPKPLFTIIDDYIRVYKITEEDSLLNYSSSQNLSDAIGNLFYFLLQKRVTIDIIRHAYCKFKDTPGRTAKQIREDAEAMAHSVEQEVDYVKDEK